VRLLISNAAQTCLPTVFMLVIHKQQGDNLPITASLKIACSSCLLDKYYALLLKKKKKQKKKGKTATDEVRNVTACRVLKR